MEQALKIKEVTKDMVILEVNAKDALAVARNPWLDSKDAYITVTRGKHHAMSVIDEDGHARISSLEWGGNSHTMTDEIGNMLKKAVIAEIEANRIPYDARVEPNAVPCSVKVFYNINYKKWQATLEFEFECQEQLWWFDDCYDYEKAIEIVRGIYPQLKTAEVAKSDLYDVWEMK